MGLTEVIKFIVPEDEPIHRSDKILAKYFPKYSRTLIQRTFEGGNVKLNGQIIGKSYKLSPGEELEIQFIELDPPAVKPVDIPIDVIYEDDDILVVNKHPGIVVHPGSGTGEDTLVHAALHYTNGNLSKVGGIWRPGIVHRLDKETSGVILLAKSDEAHKGLTDMFAARDLKKEYLALVAGVPELDSGVIKEPIERHPTIRVKMAVRPNGNPSRTDWMVERRFKKITLVRCFLHTGRTHQIRVHLSHLGHPILGDETYGYKEKMSDGTTPKRVMLHAERLTFEHPVSKEKLTIKAPIPADFTEVMKAASPREEF